MAKTVSINWMSKKDLTSEEKMLMSKYKILRALKERLLRTTEAIKENVDTECYQAEPQKQEEDSKATAIRILKAKGGLKANRKQQGIETKGFKKPSTQCHEVQRGVKRCVKGEYFPDANFKTRSVVVRGHGLTRSFLRKILSNAGDIWNIRSCDNDQSAVVTFKTSESAQLAIKMDGMSVGKDQRLFISPAKKKNPLWNEVLTSDRKFSVDKNLLQKKRTVYVSYHGLLTSNDFRWFFGTIGLVEKVYMTRPSEDKRHYNRQSYAFVTFAAEDDARRAVKELNGAALKGILLSVSPQKIPRNDNLGIAADIGRDSSRDLVAYQY